MYNKISIVCMSVNYCSISPLFNAVLTCAPWLLKITTTGWMNNYGSYHKLDFAIIFNKSLALTCSSNPGLLDMTSPCSR